MADDLQDKADSLLTRVGNALEQLLTLEIQTVVAPMEVTGRDNGGWSVVPKPGDATDGITTMIRLEQGDVQNALSTGAIDNEKLMKLHADQVALSRQIVADNLKAVVELARSLTR